MTALDVRREWHVRDALTSRDARQQGIDECLEVNSPLVLGPSGFILVQLEYEEGRWIGRRAIGQKSFTPDSAIVGLIKA